jgi:hypothetical protein
MLKVHCQNELDKFLSAINISDNYTYKLNKKRLHKLPVNHPLIGPNGLNNSAIEKIKILADSFETQFAPNFGPYLS